MTKLTRLDAFTHPFTVRVVDGEILMVSDQAPIELVFTCEVAVDTAHRLLAAAEPRGGTKRPTVA